MPSPRPPSSTGANTGGSRRGSISNSSAASTPGHATTMGRRQSALQAMIEQIANDTGAETPPSPATPQDGFATSKSATLAPPSGSGSRRLSPLPSPADTPREPFKAFGKTVSGTPGSSGLPPIPGLRRVEAEEESEGDSDDDEKHFHSNYSHNRRASDLGGKRGVGGVSSLHRSGSHAGITKSGRSTAKASPTATTDATTKTASEKGSFGRRLSQGSAFDAVKQNRYSRSRSIDDRIRNLTDEEIKEREELEKQKILERKRQRTSLSCDYVSQNKQSAFRTRPSPQNALKARRSSSLTWVGSDVSDSATPTTTPEVSPSAGGATTTLTPGGQSEMSLSGSYSGAVPLKLPEGVSREKVVASVGQQRKASQVAEREAKVEERSKRHDPEVVRVKRWLEALALSLWSDRVLRDGLQIKARHQREAWARCILTGTFLPVWWAYRRRLHRAARNIIERFLLQTVARRRLGKRGRAANIICKFLRAKSLYFPFVVRWYVCVIRRVQKMTRMFLQRREAQVELNLRKVRAFEHDVYWFDAKTKRDRLEAKRKMEMRTATAATSGSPKTPPTTALTPFSLSPDAKPPPLETTAFLDQFVRWNDEEPLQREVPKFILQRQIRTLISRKARDYHREDMKRDATRRSLQTSPAAEGSAGGPSSYTPSPPPSSTADHSGRSLERRGSSVFREVDVWRNRPTPFAHLFNLKECRGVLDEACQSTAMIQRDNSWKSHLVADLQRVAARGTSANGSFMKNQGSESPLSSTFDPETFGRKVVG